ncbi:30S ribosomal protein S17 [Kiritimatiella glycovorans]|uniref:Small ribosomal subunit protein uS17 n=1 Tax=Kiritimatiella glycovorans TaxID=1307763 RepID=A0A0G3EF36_9BACT|nr:30S ribosomal protein S17 [Kiritimatiella glycovorans]AKJ64948.1 30S ribosomal protein S17 [Kiritimatiella glycovorans]
MTETQSRGNRKERIGHVVRNSGDKTISVSVERHVRHPLYGKEMRVSRRFLVHDEDNAAKVGDKVRIMETRPVSRRKRWRLVDVVGGDTEPRQ